MGRVVVIVVLLLAGWYCYKTGMFYVLSHDLQPEPNKVSELVGPVGTGVNMAFAEENAKYLIDTHIGTAGQKLEAVQTLNAVIARGDAVNLDDHTKVKALESDKVKVYGCDYAVVQVEVVDGDHQGTNGWVERENVIDNPLQQLFQSMRGTTLPKNIR